MMIKQNTSSHRMNLNDFKPCTKNNYILAKIKQSMQKLSVQKMNDKNKA
jgi:hypothetical protein